MRVRATQDMVKRRYFQVTKGYAGNLDLYEAYKDLLGRVLGGCKVWFDLDEKSISELTMNPRRLK